MPGIHTNDVASYYTQHPHFGTENDGLIISLYKIRWCPKIRTDNINLSKIYNSTILIYSNTQSIRIFNTIFVKMCEIRPTKYQISTETIIWGWVSDSAAVI